MGSVNVRLTLIIQQLLSEGTNGRKLMETLLAMAFDGNLEAIKVLLDRNDGKVKDQVEHSGAIATAKPLAMYTTEELEQLRFIALAAEQRERP